VRNLASIPKTSEQISEMRTVTQKEKYLSLSDNANSINL
jgi:hypothetical protein